jgi:signal transduction histidine kinase
MTTDYLRLSLYIAHEQKNALSLLRARMQLAGNAELSAEIDRVANGIDDVLTLSASEGMKHDEIVDAALVCADVCDEYRKIYPRISFTFDELANSQIRGRELWIHRAVSNLVDNAIKYGNGSEIKVEVKNKKGSVIITVADEGIGIDENKLEKIFENRYRINELKKDGYGIGLSLVHHVCELCGGAAHVESQKGKGSTFYMVFPQAFTEN